MKTFLSKYMGFAILAGAMVYAVATVLYNQMQYEAPDVTTVRITHWQLEAGFREALDKLGREFEAAYLERTGEKVRILQVPISERAYKQYVNTGLIGDMAPDIIEKGFAKTATDPSYIARFFVPLSEYVTKPNPYNDGTPLEGVAWKDTFSDGMQSAYDSRLLDYYFIPFSMFTIRIYYNADLYKEVLGRDDPPSSYSDFMDVCEQIKAHAKKTGQLIVPIAASKAQGSYFANKYTHPFTVDLVEQSDLNFSGQTDRFESYIAQKKGLWRFDSPCYLASSKCLMEIAKNFPDGWLAALRDDALFMFAQKRAVMIASGSWDAQSIIDQTKDYFSLGVFDFPMPTDHPEYSKFVKGGMSEAGIGGGIPWSINKKSPKVGLCVEFLQFATTKERNEQFTGDITWLPVVRGVEMHSETLKGFKPSIHGYTGDLDFRISTAVDLLNLGNRWPLYAGQMTAEENARQMQEMYDRTAEDGYRTELDKTRRTLRNTERIVAASQACRVFIPSEAENLRKKLVQLNRASQEAYHGYYASKARFEELQH